jgi:hypothetical protein
VQGGHLVLVVEVWPNHSPDLTARRIRAAAEHALRRRGLRRAERLWARGYAVTTDLEQLDEMEQQFLETCR